MRLIDSCITQLKAQGPYRTCNESKEDEKSLGLRVEGWRIDTVGFAGFVGPFFYRNVTKFAPREALRSIA